MICIYTYIYTSFGQPKNKTTIWGWFIPPMSKGDFGDGWWDCVLPDYMSYVVRRFPKSPPNHPFFHRISINKNHPAIRVPPAIRKPPFQWPFQVAKLEVLYHIKLNKTIFGGYIASAQNMGLVYMVPSTDRFLNWPVTILHLGQMSSSKLPWKCIRLTCYAQLAVAWFFWKRGMVGVGSSPQWETNM